jgi:protein-S-isoprenylcysteine O-methyltransferase Ste14
MARKLKRWSIGVFLVGAIVMVLGNGWTDPWLWAYVGTWALVSLYALVAIDDDLAKERFSPPEPGEDRLPLVVVRLAALGHLIIGALDGGRLHLAPVAPSLRTAGLIGMAVSCLFVFHAMLTNRFFSPVVRIQKERGHRVIDAGPYRLVRHPGYAGMIVAAPLSGLALGSWFSVAIALVYSGMILRRVFFEDAFLRQNLDGYPEYADRVRYRLVPGLF